MASGQNQFVGWRSCGVTRFWSRSLSDPLVQSGSNKDEAGSPTRGETRQNLQNSALRTSAQKLERTNTWRFSPSPVRTRSGLHVGLLTRQRASAGPLIGTGDGSDPHHMVAARASQACGHQQRPVTASVCHAADRTGP